jgi:chromosomal replication initiator protein
MKNELERLETFLCEEFKITPEQLKSKSRKTAYVVPRHIFCYIAKYYNSHLPLKAISGYLGGRDHSTASTAIKKVNGYIDTDYSYKRLVSTLKLKFRDFVEPQEYYPYAS